jgi:hypothetical protein
MGGAQSIYVSLKHPDKFAWAGLFSPGCPILPGVRVMIEPPSGARGRSGAGWNERINLDAQTAERRRTGGAEVPGEAWCQIFGGTEVCSLGEAAGKQLDRYK